MKTHEGPSHDEPLASPYQSLKRKGKEGREVRDG
jgi:hypothetical protein